MQPHVIFIVNLLQDVNVIRPLAYIAARDLSLPVLFLLSHKFLQRDSAGVWREEVQDMEDRLGASSVLFQDCFEAIGHLEGKAGYLVAGSESNLSAHDTVHDVLRAAPPAYVRITLQHGFECVGFRQSRDQNLAHGRDITSAADILCGWFPVERMNAMAASQRPKLYVSGPPMALQTRTRIEGQAADRGGFICENLHSPRFHAAGDFKMDFLQTFNAFCAEQERQGLSVTLRPHPGGRYVLKNDVPLPTNVTLNTDPIYKVDLSRYAYGISAPSSVLIDMILAGIPVAVWNDGGAVMDVGNYEGLTVIRSLQDWLAFSRAASADPGPFLQKQADFLAAQQMPIDPREVHGRFAALFGGTVDAIATDSVGCLAADSNVPAVRSHPRRVMFVANGYIPTLQLSFVKPLSSDPDFSFGYLLEEEMKKLFKDKLRTGDARCEWIVEQLSGFSPDLLVFCRYSGPYADLMTQWAQQSDVPVIFHIDDDLLNIPRELGDKKYLFHNDPARLATVRHLLDYSDLIYVSTPRLKSRVEGQGARAPAAAGKIYASGKVLQTAVERPVRLFGYMGFDHAHDLETVLPALVTFLRRNSDVLFELFGSIPKPAVLDEFGDRVSVIPPVRNYEEFLGTFAQRQWDVGICPLASTPFNLVKANTKWVEYTSVGTAVIASRDTVYDDCCADGCGILATTYDEWLAALEQLAHDPKTRFEQVKRAQDKLTHVYSTEALKEQVLNIFAKASGREAPETLEICTN